ncbi:lyase family protein [Nocardioides sp. GXQ0305]|uniref:lyase family protein n=1 Tax=Nocardioides sp. GXQ0305 TaxID=3423912 RepID=UPI003D7D0CC6
MSRLLAPGSHRAAGVADDAALVAALLRVEVAWSRALVVAGLADAAAAEAVERAAAGLRPDLAGLLVDTEAAANPVVPLVVLLRKAVGDGAPIHRGLTSQDVLDTALVLLARDALGRVGDDLAATAGRLAGLARTHRDTVMAGRTLTQHAVATTFGLKVAQRMAAVDDAADAVGEVRGALPVQYGGAAGTRALLVHLAPDADPDAVPSTFADALGLRPDLPWHTRRGVVTGTGDVLVTATDALGALANDVLLLGRPEIGEVSEGAAPGRGGSSTMPHKRNPVLAVLVRAAALQAPQLAAQLHLAAASGVDERPDGAWHAEWPAFARLLELTVTAASQARELVDGLEVDAAAMAARADASAEALLAESGGHGDVRDHLGEAGAVVDALVARHDAQAAARG